MAEASVILKPRCMGHNNLGHSVRKASSCSLVLGLNSTWSFDGKREAKINGSWSVIIQNYSMLLRCFWKKVSFCYSAWLISGSHWIIVPCLQLIKARLTSLTTLPWFLWWQGEKWCFLQASAVSLTCLEGTGLCQEKPALQAGLTAHSSPCKGSKVPYSASQIAPPGSGLGKDTEPLKPPQAVQSLSCFLESKQIQGVWSWSTNTHAHTNLHPIKCSYRENPFQYFLVVGWLVDLLVGGFLSQTVCAEDYLQHINTYFHFGKNWLWPEFFSICFYSISTSWEIKIIENKQPHKMV